MKKRKYHILNIKKGKLGESSKILEEIYELIDSEKQHSKTMALLECCDIYGALEEYVNKNFPNFNMNDIKTFSDITKNSFK